ncbi:hypothetical protein [Promicromonospora sp. NPDC090134]
MARRFRTAVRSAGKLTDEAAASLVEAAASLVEAADQITFNVGCWHNG